MKLFFIFSAWIISILAFVTSLYFSEIKHLLPCLLCWYERMTLFPLTILLGISYYKKDIAALSYALPFAFLGLALSFYHTFLQVFPRFAFFCKESYCQTQLGQPLSLIPFFSLGVFILISALLVSCKIRRF